MFKENLVDTSFYNLAPLDKLEFPSIEPVIKNLELEVDQSFHISLWLKIRPTKQDTLTVLDFSHTSTEGATLQYHVSGETPGTLTWLVAGSALTEVILPGIWSLVIAGYDAVSKKSWLSIDQGNRHEIKVSSAPFNDSKVQLGIGCWLKNHSRDLSGYLFDIQISQKKIDNFEELRTNFIKTIGAKNSEISHNSPDSTEKIKEYLKLLLISASNAAPIIDEVNHNIHFVCEEGNLIYFCLPDSPLFSLTHEKKETSLFLTERGKRSPFDAEICLFITSVIKEDIIASAWHLQNIVALGYQPHYWSNTRQFPSHTYSVNFAFIKKPFNLDLFAQQLLEFDFSAFPSHFSFISAVIACGQMLYKEKGLKVSAKWLTDFQNTHGVTHSISDVLLAQEYHSTGQKKDFPLVKNMAVGGLEYLEFFKGHHCNHPFEDFEMRSDGGIFVCCPSYLPESIGNAYKMDDISELKNSEKGDKIRDSILRQDYRYCRWMHCDYIPTLNELNLKKERLCNITEGGREIDQIQSENPSIERVLFKQGPTTSIDISPEYIEKTREALERIDIDNISSEYQPAEFTLSYDPTCNLWCPSCRSEKIVAKGKQREKILDITDKLVLPLLREAKTCMMNGYGDVFASKACRKILESVNPSDYSKLKFNFITNAVLFNRKEWEQLPDIHKMVRSIRVSVDASRKKTYDKVRLGGDWDELMKNLHFISELRRINVIEEFMISFVIQQENFREMAEFGELGIRLGCDKVLFEPIMNWNSFKSDDFMTKAVHYAEHELNKDFLKEIDKLKAVFSTPPPGFNKKDVLTLSDVYLN